MMRDKMQTLILLMLIVALYIVVVPTAFMRYPLAMQVFTFWVVFALAADRIIGGSK